MVESIIKKYIEELNNTIEKLPIKEIKYLAKLLLKAYRENKQIFIMGNGGNGSTAAHFVNDMSKYLIISDSKKIIYDRKRARSICLNDNIALITAWSNDSGFEKCFSEQLKNYDIGEGDIVIGISGSGNSANILKALEVSKEYNA